MMSLPDSQRYTQAQQVQLIRDRYLDGRAQVDESNLVGLARLYTDRFFVHSLYHSVYNFVRTAVDVSVTPIYVARFGFEGSRSYAQLLTGNKNATHYGVVHGDDNLYLFQSPDLYPPFQSQSLGWWLSAAQVQYYTEFAVTGRPSATTELAEGGQGALVPCTEQTVNAERFCDYRLIRNKVDGSTFEAVVDRQFDMGMVKFWDDLVLA